MSAKSARHWLTLMLVGAFGLGGRVGRTLGIIGGFTAEVPIDRVHDLRADRSVLTVKPNATVRLSSGGFDGFAPKQDNGSMYWIAQEVTGAGPDNQHAS